MFVFRTLPLGVVSFSHGSERVLSVCSKPARNHQNHISHYYANPYQRLQAGRLAVFTSLLLASRAFAYDTVWTGSAGDGDFFNPANWTSGPPVNNNSSAIALNQTATIDTNSPFYSGSGAFYMNYLDLGDSSEATTNLGTLVINNGFVHMSENSGDIAGIIGWNTNGYSKMIINGGTVYFDGPDGNVSGKFGALWRTNFGAVSGVNNINFNCGTSYTVASLTNNPANGNDSFGRLELHSNALMRVATVFKMGDMGATATNANLAYPLVLESGVLVMDGNSELDIGDGFTVGKELTSSSIDLSGNAKLVIGNTMGAGNPNGSSQQGYYTDGARNSTYSTTTVRDNAQLQCMTLQCRAPGSILVTNYAKFMIYNVLAGSGTIRYPFQSSYIAAVDITNNPFGEGSNEVFTVADHGTFYVDAWGFFGTAATPDANSNLINGLVIGNGNFQSGKIKGGNGFGSRGTLIIQDYGTLDIRQGLYLGTAANLFSDGTLQVIGPNTTVTIGTNLSLCVGYDGITVGSGARGRISEVITGPTHSTITVSNNSLIHAQGTLQLVLRGYTPVGGESYTLLRNINGTNDGAFATNDFTSAPLSPGLVWQITTTSNTVIASVLNTFKLQRAGGNLAAVWSNETGIGTNLLFTNILQSSSNAKTGYTDVTPTATSPYTINQTNATRFFRLRH